jgi:hypothetical protein
VADGYVRVVDVLRRLEWGFGGEGSCSGWVQVDGDDDAPPAWVTAHVSIAAGLILTLSRKKLTPSVVCSRLRSAPCGGWWTVQHPPSMLIGLVR